MSKFSIINIYLYKYRDMHLCYARWYWIISSLSIISNWI